MNNDKGRLNYGVGLDNSQLRVGVAESRRLLQGIGQTAVDEGARIDDSFKRIGRTVAGVFAVSQIKDFITHVATVRGEFQQLEIAFKTMLGSAGQADVLMTQLVKTAATTPFGLKDIGQAAKQLLAYGVAANDVNSTLIRLGDIAAGLSIPINDLAYLYGTTMVQGRLYTQDLNQFLGRGIPLMEELAKQFGVAENQVKQLVEDGKVGFPEVQKAIENLTNEGSKFGGLMEAQSKTITGQISNIEDAIDTMFNAIGQSQEGVINTSLGLVSTLIENWETVGNILLTIIATYGAYKAAVIAVAAAHKLMNIWGTVSAFLSLTTSIRSAKDAMLLFNMAVKANPLGLVLSVLAAAVTAFLAFRKSTDEAADALKKEREEAEAFNKQVSESAGKAISTYKRLQDEYKKCKSAHEKREWIKESQTKFKELGIAVNSVNDAENIFVKNTSLMMKAFQKRAEAAAWQSRLDEAYAKRVERQMALEDQMDKIQAGSKVPGYSHTTQGGYEYVDRNGAWVYTEAGARKAREAFKQTIIFKIGYDMLQAHFTHVKLNETERKEYSKDITITPLAIPMLCGPGAISSGITLMEDASEYTFKIVLLGVIALVCILSFFILCASTQLLKILGETGNNVMMRLMGLILMVIAVECFISGIRPVLIEILKQAHACS